MNDVLKNGIVPLMLSAGSVPGDAIRLVVR